MAERLAAVELVIARKVGETEALYGSVTSADIAELFAAQGLRGRPRKLLLAEPIKALGRLRGADEAAPRGTAHVKVKVVAEAPAAE